MQSEYLSKFKQPTNSILALASLFEGEFNIGWLSKLSGIKSKQILSELQLQVDQKIIANTKPAFYAFVDKTIRDKLRQQLPSEQEEALHRGIADLLIRELPENEDKWLTLSHHLINIKNDLKQCYILFEAGDHFRHSFLNEQSIQCYAKILQDLTTITNSEADRLFVETAIRYSKISTARHKTADVLTMLQEALTRAKRQNNIRGESLLDMHIAKNEWVCGRYDKAISHFEKGWDIAFKLEDQQFQNSVSPFGTFFLYWQGKFRDAVTNYEASLPNISRYPERRFPLMGAITVGYCYAQIGQITQGLGMIDSIRMHCLSKGDKHIASVALTNLGEIMLMLRRLDEARKYIQEAIKISYEVQNRWVWIGCQVIMAFIHKCSGEQDHALYYLQEFLKHSREVGAPPYPYILEMCLAMELGQMPRVDGLSLEQEIEKTIQSQNVFLKGLSYRYHAFLLTQGKCGSKQIINSYHESIRWLSLSGHAIELARTQNELASYYTSLGEKIKAKESADRANNVLSNIWGLASRPKEDLLDTMFQLGKDVVHLRDNRELMGYIISIITQVTGAERGAIFLVEQDDSNHEKISLVASKNLTLAEVDQNDFRASMQLIKKTIRTGQSSIKSLDIRNDPKTPLQGAIRSMICLPMILRDRVIGVLYHDNRLLTSAFNEQDITALINFVTLATIALDNAQAYEEISELNQKLQIEKKYYEEEHTTFLHFDQIVGTSPAMEKIINSIRTVAETSATVLITGETGVGKELVARAIHRISKRSTKPFISVQLSSLAENLIPSELFGHEKGSFTGATQRRIGRFELANDGTLFLDEIADISEEIQVRLLRVLQTRQFERVGGTTHLTSDFRLIAATNRILAHEIKEGKFRKDFYYRLSVFPIHVPPLRDRKDDIPLLAYHFLRIHAKKLGKAVSTIPKTEMEKLIKCQWPGNVRELENIIERSVILSKGKSLFIVEFDQLENLSSNLEMTLAENERQHILKTLEKTDWKVAGSRGAAKMLGIPASTLSFHMKKLGIIRP